MSGFTLSKNDIADCPDWLAELVKPAKKPPVAANDERVSTYNTDGVIVEGSRNDALFRHACRLRSMGMCFENALTALKDINHTQCVVPLGDRELRSILNSAFSYANSATTEALTEFGNASRMVCLFGKDLRYVPEHDKFHCWDDSIWKADKSMRVEGLVKTMVASIRQEIVAARQAEDDDLVDALMRHEKNSQRKSHP